MSVIGIIERFSGAILLLTDGGTSSYLVELSKARFPSKKIQVRIDFYSNFCLPEIISAN